MSQEERLNRKQEERLRRELHEAREALQRAQLDHESASKKGEALERYTIALRSLSDFLVKR